MARARRDRENRLLLTRRRLRRAPLVSAVAVVLVAALPLRAAADVSLDGAQRTWLGVGGTWALEENGTAGVQLGFGSTHYFSDRWGIGGEIDYNSAHFSGDLVTGVLRWCPAYTLFGISSCPAATTR